MLGIFFPSHDAAWENTLISPGYIDAMRELVERDTGAPSLFLQGANGELGPREVFVGDIAMADRIGLQSRSARPKSGLSKSALKPPPER
jgi:hypothetical protein